MPAAQLASLVNNFKNMKNKKKTLARRLMSKEEILKNVPIFQSQTWDLRKDFISKKVQNKILKIKKKKIKKLSEAISLKKDTDIKIISKKISPKEIEKARLISKTEIINKKIRKIVGISIVILSMLVLFPKDSIANDQLDYRYSSEYQENASSSIEFFYNGNIKLPIQAIYIAKIYGDFHDYKPTLILIRYYFKGEITGAVACLKYLEFENEGEINCR